MIVNYEHLSVVLAANDINLSIFRPLWLQKNNIITEQELSGQIVITPVAVQIPTRHFELSILPNRIQMICPSPYAEMESDLIRIIGGIAKTLPHTPYSGVGVNFNYFACPEDSKTFLDWNKQLFSSGFSQLAYPAEDPEERFGSYFSYDVLGARLKVDVKPVKAPVGIEKLCKLWGRNQDLIRVNLNFHTALTNSETNVDTILETLKKWDQAFSLSKEIIEKL